MESEKVKEILGRLHCKLLGDRKNEINHEEINCVGEVITLINELESENKRLLESCKNCHYIKDLEIANGHAKELKDRIAELEDKIENGTLIETEYPIYQDVYFIDYVDENYYSVGVGKGKPTVRKAFIHSVEQVMKGQILYLIQPHDLPQEVLDNSIEHTEVWEWYHYSKKNLFLTKAEAEKKLEELSKNP